MNFLESKQKARELVARTVQDWVANLPIDDPVALEVALGISHPVDQRKVVDDLAIYATGLSRGVFRRAPHPGNQFWRNRKAEAARLAS